MGFIKREACYVTCDGCGLTICGKDGTTLFRDEIHARQSLYGLIVGDKVYCPSCRFARTCDRCNAVVHYRVKQHLCGGFLCERCERERALL